MQVKGISEIFANSGPFWQGTRGICSKWRSYPPKPAVYLIATEESFKWGKKKTDILYIGCTKHFGGIEFNCRLWDYHTKATPQENRIVDYVIALDDEGGEPVKIYWTHKFPCNYSHREYEKQLLRRFKLEHGKPPRLNRSL
jgi:hypothetical protein